MYSIVMLTAMSAGADVTPPVAPPPHAGMVAVAPMATGCCGGVVMTGCSGCYGSSCYGSSCHGCSGGGGGFLGRRSGGGLFHRNSCQGCTGCGGGTYYANCHGSGHGSCSGYNCFGSTTSYGSS